MQNENLRKAREKQAELRASGLAPERVKKPSKAKAVRNYFRQHHGVVENTGMEGVLLLRADAAHDFKLSQDRAKTIGWKATVSEICWKCECGDDDPGAGARIANCNAPHCAIHPVRPKIAIHRPPTLPNPY